MPVDSTTRLTVRKGRHKVHQGDIGRAAQAPLARCRRHAYLVIGSAAGAFLAPWSRRPLRGRGRPPAGSASQRARRRGYGPAAPQAHLTACRRPPGTWVDPNPQCAAQQPTEPRSRKPPQQPPSAAAPTRSVRAADGRRTGQPAIYGMPRRSPPHVPRKNRAAVASACASIPSTCLRRMSFRSAAIWGPLSIVRAAMVSSARRARTRHPARPRRQFLGLFHRARAGWLLRQGDRRLRAVRRHNQRPRAAAGTDEDGDVADLGAVGRQLDRLRRRLRLQPRGWRRHRLRDGRQGRAPGRPLHDDLLRQGIRRAAPGVARPGIAF